uniref:Uncharacterized protein LOC104228125 n=1 Tax=Nicotiana sylvestris TaxID=4096 RepID=A0A1U7WFT6_NICSY|nr:PREDICTED: uncharacterized protein LOC104228125 [Nicotiana sylvestris]
MIVGLELAKSLGEEVIEAKCDSLLVVNQVNRTFEVREDRMQRYLEKLQEIHKGTCGNRSGAKSLVHKVIRAGYYWAIMEKDTKEFIRKCQRMPTKIVCDNEKQFVGSKMTKFLEDHKIKRILSTPYHPSRNGQAESTNKPIIQNLKKRLTDTKGKWRDILPEVLWAYHTTSKFITGATPFSLVYGAEALFPVEVGEPHLRFRYATEESNNESMITSLKLLDERCEAALV